MIKYCPIGHTTENLTEALTGSNKIIAHHEEHIRRAKDALKDNINDGLIVDISHAIHNEHTSAALQLKNYLELTAANNHNLRGSITYTTELYNIELKRRAELEQLIKEREANPFIYPTIDLDELRAQLNTCPNVVQDSAKLFKENEAEDIATALWVSWTLTGIKMTPDENPYANLNNKTVFAIELPPIAIAVNICSGDIKIQGATPEGNRRTTFGNHCHPHVMHNQSPCLGDFELAVFQTLEVGDIAAFNDLIIVFLSQATNSDAAGKTWPQFMSKNLHRHITRDMNNFSIYTENQAVSITQVPIITVLPSGLFVESYGIATVIPRGANVDYISADTVIKSAKSIGFTLPDWILDFGDIQPEQDMSKDNNSPIFKWR